MDLDKALSEIGEIRSQMARQVLFQGLGPVAVACTGLLALLFGGAQLLLPEMLSRDPLHFVLSWVGLTMVSSIFVVAHMWRRARFLHGTQHGAQLNRIFEQLMPSLCATAAITWAFARFAEPLINALPGLWLLLAALACFSMAASLGNRMRFVGGWYFVSGAAVLVVGLNNPADLMSPWLLAIPFFIGQSAMALALRLESHSDLLVSGYGDD